MTARDPLVVKCPLCDAEPGQVCKNLRVLRSFNPNRLTDRSLYVRPHRIRKEVAAR